MADILASVAGVRLADCPFTGGPGAVGGGRSNPPEMHTAGKPTGEKVPAGLLGERGDRQPRRQLHPNRPAEGRGRCFSTMLVSGIARGDVATSVAQGNRGIPGGSDYLEVFWEGLLAGLALPRVSRGRFRLLTSCGARRSPRPRPRGVPKGRSRGA